MAPLNFITYKVNLNNYDSAKCMVGAVIYLTEPLILVSVADLILWP